MIEPLIRHQLNVVLEHYYPDNYKGCSVDTYTDYDKAGYYTTHLTVEMNWAGLKPDAFPGLSLHREENDLEVNKTWRRKLYYIATNIIELQNWLDQSLKIVEEKKFYAKLEETISDNS